MTKADILNLLSACPLYDPLAAEEAEYAILDYLPRTFKYTYTTGASKFVIIPKDEKFVIKIPLTGYYTGDYNLKMKEWYSFYRPNKNGCKHKYLNWDYCAGELFLYHEAIKHKIEQAFCKISYIGSINNYPIYIQRKAVPCTEYSNSRPSPMFDSDLCDTAWQASMFNYYGQKFYNKLLKFIDDYSIYDLHKNNIGYINDKPVLIDFNSYNC